MNNELHFLIGFPGSGKSYFIDNYCKNEKIDRFYKMDFRIQFNRFYSGANSDIVDLNNHLNSLDLNQSIFVELPIKLQQYYHNNNTCTFKNSLSMICITNNFAVSKNYNLENIFVHIFESMYTDLYIPHIDWHNLTLHRPSFIKGFSSDKFDRFLEKPFGKRINDITYDESFDWNIMNNRKYCEFKRKHNFSDFILLSERSRTYEEKKYSNNYNNCEWVPCDDTYDDTYTTIPEILASLKDKSLRTLSYFKGRELENNGALSVEYSLYDYYSCSTKTENYFSVPHLFSFLNKSKTREVKNDD